MLVSCYDFPWLDSGWLRYFVLFARCEYGTEYIGKIETTGLSDIKRKFESSRYEYSDKICSSRDFVASALKSDVQIVSYTFSYAYVYTMNRS